MRYTLFLLLLFLFGCDKPSRKNSLLFTNVSETSGISFLNELRITEQINPYTYRGFFNGAGVAVGDINNDGLQDIYFTGNQVDNKLYLNKGNLVFEDITETAGVACKNVWSTGVTFVDVNADGLLDIYVCKSGPPGGANRHNELFINNGDLTFSEKSKEYGLDITGLSVHAAFFDFDKDDDLDCYVLTNSIKSVGNFDLVKDIRNIPDANSGGNKFLVNVNGKFEDRTKESGIYSSIIGFGLGITLGDFNNDTWTDIFISNDFFERDYLYINNQKGGYTESLTNYFQSVSMGSMGADFADLNNDGSAELFVTEMLPDSLKRKKTKMVYENWNKYQLNLDNGYYHQFPRNVLQTKIDEESYAEIGRFSGISASEWSWGALIFDMDNDGRRDIFIANGITKDLLDRDYLTYTGAEDNVRKIIKENDRAITKLIDLMPSSQFLNYAYRNEGDFKFTNVSTEWGFDEPFYSSGSAYADFDNDGDLDLIVNNINAPSVLYRNNTDTATHKSITIKVSSKTKNTFAIGTRVLVYAGKNLWMGDNFVTRGYQSSTQPWITIGLGKDIENIDSIFVRWPSGDQSMIYNVKPNQQIQLDFETSPSFTLKTKSKSDFYKPRLELISKLIFKHQASGLVDFNRDRLLPMMYSNETPSFSKGDVNGDGEEEIYIGGGKDQEGGFIQVNSAQVSFKKVEAIAKYKIAEETKGVFFDADGDHDLDFYMACGGRFFPGQSSALSDKIFLNKGNGEFYESSFSLPFTTFVSTSVVKPIDFDKDGDNDLIIGERFEPYSYGVGGRGYLFKNDGRGAFSDVTNELAPDLLKIGMITDLEVVDVNSDSYKDIVVVGDWMPIVILQNLQGKFSANSNQPELSGTEGWWHEIESADFNKDGKPDFIVGNQGLNSFFKSGDRMYVSDFDKNGSIEQLFCTKIGDNYYPIVDRDELLSQIPSLKKQLLYYKDYATKPITGLFSNEILDLSKVYQINILSSILMLSSKNGYRIVQLPREAQYSPIYAILISDIDNDGIEDLVVGGNQYLVKPQFGRYDASSGWFFKGRLMTGEYSFEPAESLNIRGQIRDIRAITQNGKKYIYFAKYDDEVEIYAVR